MTHPIIEGLTEAVTMAKLMRENEELRGELSHAKASAEIGWGQFEYWSNLYLGAAKERDDAWAELAEEQALADRLYGATSESCADHDWLTARESYRKARGL